jgi:hypothetical protein
MQILAPVRASRSYVQRLEAPAARVFPLLCPVREADWIVGWDPESVWSNSGVAERDCVFITGSGTERAIWVVTRHEPENGFVEMLKIVPELTACRLTITLRDTAIGCDARVEYTHTSLGPAGDVFVAGFDEGFYRDFMQQWERRLNHYLRSGERLDPAAAG